MLYYEDYHSQNRRQNDDFLLALLVCYVEGFAFVPCSTVYLALGVLNSLIKIYFISIAHTVQQITKASKFLSKLMLNVIVKTEKD